MGNLWTFDMKSITEHHTNSQDTAPPVLHVGISRLFHNKENRAPHTRWCKQHQTHDKCWAFSTSFEPTKLPLTDFVQHVLNGGAFTLGYFKNKRRIKANFVLAELVGLDFDNGVSVAQATADPFIRQYAFLIYPTPSSTPEHPKTRVLFRLSEPVYEAARWEALQRGLIDHYAHWQPDKSCKDSARLFYGSDREGGIQL